MFSNHELRTITALCFFCTIFVSASSQTRRNVDVLQTLPKLQRGQVEAIFTLNDGPIGANGVGTWRAPADLEELTVYGLGSGGSGGGGGGGHARNTTGPVYRSGAGGGGGGAARLMVFKVSGVKKNDIFQISIGRSGAGGANGVGDAASSSDSNGKNGVAGGDSRFFGGPIPGDGLRFPGGAPGMGGNGGGPAIDWPKGGSGGAIGGGAGGNGAKGFSNSPQRVGSDGQAGDGGAGVGGGIRGNTLTAGDQPSGGGGGGGGMTSPSLAKASEKIKLYVGNGGKGGNGGAIETPGHTGGAIEAPLPPRHLPVGAGGGGGGGGSASFNGGQPGGRGAEGSPGIVVIRYRPKRP